jgi:general secretion pathway protein N
MAGAQMIPRALIALLAVVGASLAHAANTPGALDLPPTGVTPPVIDMLPGPASPQAPAARPERERSGNPLWAIPLSALTATRERPIFLPSRRAPAPALAGPPPVAPAPAAAPPAAPERPQLTLVGAVVGENGAIAIFLDTATNNVIRLRTGEGHGGWTLQSVKGREATFLRNRETATFSLPPPGQLPGVPGVVPPGAPGVPGAPVPGAPPGQQKEPEL